MKNSVVFGFVWLLSACQGGEVEEPIHVLGPVTEMGPHAVGTREADFVDGEGDFIPVQTWYPTADTTGTSTVSTRYS